MRKIFLIIFIFVLFWINNAFSANSTLWNLNYNNNTVNCTNTPTINNISWIKYIPSINNLNASVSANSNLCQSWIYFWEISSWYISKNISRTCDDLLIVDWYASWITCYDNSNIVRTCTWDWSWWTKYILKCKYKLDDSLIELNSAPFNNSWVADWVDKNIEISFPLTYWNLESNINYIDFTFVITDNTSINWFDKNKNSISNSAVTITDWTTQNSFSWPTRTIKYRLINWWNLDTMKSGDKFNFRYKFYNPTTLASDIFPSVIDWFIFKTITYDIVFNDWWSLSWHYVEDKANNTNINNSTIPLKLKPLFEFTNSWDIVNTWFIEWRSQTWSINIIKNSLVSPSIDWLYFVQTWINSNYFSWTWTISPSVKSFSINSMWNKLLSSFSTSTTYVLKTLFTLTDLSWYRDDIKNIRLNEYIRYATWWRTVTYLAWVLNQANTQNFDTLKIYWITNIDKDKQKDLTLNQDITDIQNLAWEITKASLKGDIRKSAINATKFINTEDNNSWIYNLIWNIWNDPNNWWKVLWNILYYGDLSWSNVILWNWTELSVTWKKTIVVIWWNLYIKSNIINSTSSDILWIIVLKDSNWKWWNLYIDTSVTEVDAIIYTDKSVISYNEAYDNGDSNVITKHEVDWNIDNSVMQNQLYILWTVFSENTIWGSRLNPPVCPFYTYSISWFICDSIEAQKYDFNYLRWWTNNAKYTSTPMYPVVIKYNSTMQSTPPPLFSK